MTRIIREGPSLIIRPVLAVGPSVGAVDDRLDIVSMLAVNSDYDAQGSYGSDDKSRGPPQRAARACTGEIKMRAGQMNASNKQLNKGDRS